MTQAAERFDWNDMVDCARFCQETLARSATVMGSLADLGAYITGDGGNYRDDVDWTADVKLVALRLAGIAAITSVAIVRGPPIAGGDADVASPTAPVRRQRGPKCWARGPASPRAGRWRGR